MVIFNRHISFTFHHSAFLVVILCVLPMTDISAQSDKELKDSLKAATEALAYKPDSIGLRLKKAGWNVQLKQWQYALDEYDIILKYQPDNIAALYFRAYVNEQFERYNFARLDYENLLKLVPGNFEARLGLALLNQKDKHFTEATNQINILISQHPDSAVAYATRAGMEKEDNLLLLAEYDYTEAIKRDADNTDYLLSRAGIRIELKHYDDAHADLDKLVSLGVNRSRLLYYYKKCRKK